MNDVAVRLEHVDLLDGLDRLGVELLKRLLELLVVGAGPGGGALDLSPGVPLPLRRALAIRCSVGIGSGLLDSGGAHRTLINHVSFAIYAMRPAMASPTHQCGLPGRAS